MNKLIYMNSLCPLLLGTMLIPSHVRWCCPWCCSAVLTQFLYLISTGEGERWEGKFHRPQGKCSLIFSFLIYKV
jgi:hypothetical protein